MPQRFAIPLPPSSVTGELGSFLDGLWQWATSQPRFSAFSGVDPNSSAVTGIGGNYAFNVTGASGVSRLWVNDGLVVNTNSWRTIA